MVFPLHINSQITDAVTQANTKKPRSPEHGAVDELSGRIIKALGIATQKGVSDHLQAVTIANAANHVGISLLYPIDSRQIEVTPEDVISYLRKLIDQGAG